MEQIIIVHRQKCKAIEIDEFVLRKAVDKLRAKKFTPKELAIIGHSCVEGLMRFLVKHKKDISCKPIERNRFLVTSTKTDLNKIFR